MGVQAKIIVGIPVQEQDFWNVTGQVPHCYSCRADRQGKHCSECGYWLKPRKMREPLWPLVVLGRNWGMPDPEEVWKRLTTGSEPLRVFSVDAAYNYLDKRGGEPWHLAFGHEVAKSPILDLGYGAPPPTAGTCSLDVLEIESTIQAVIQGARNINLERDCVPGIYLVLESM